MNFKQITISDWKQFERINIEFHPNITVLTGANGSGKTTILNLLARHFGWGQPELATPAIDKISGFFKFFSRFFKSPNNNTEQKIGELHYFSGQKSDLIIQNSDSAQYYVEIIPQQSIQGINIPSHRPNYSYRQVSQIQTRKRTKEEAYSLAQSSSQQYYFGNPGQQTSNYYLKETLLNWAIGGSGNEFIIADNESRQNFLGFQDVLRKVLPKTIGFREISIRNYEIVFITDTGDFMLDAVSGGVSAIIDLTWQIYTFAQSNVQRITILIDEIENHLHPNMQRSILPDLISAFPNIQFIVSTHSPLVVGSVRDSNVYAFRYKEVEGKLRVVNEKLDLINKAKTATEILDEVLGVPFTMPLWVESQLNELVTRYSRQGISENTFDNMRSELKQIGLEELMPEAINKTLNR